MSNALYLTAEKDGVTYQVWRRGGEFEVRLVVKGGPPRSVKVPVSLIRSMALTMTTSEDDP